MLPSFLVLVVVFSVEFHIGVCHVLNGGNNSVDLKGGSFSIKNSNNSRTTGKMRTILCNTSVGDGQDSNKISLQESRKKKRRDKDGESMIEKLLPMMVMPFMMSSTMSSAMIISMFFMLVNSAVMGKIGLIMMLIDMFKDKSKQGDDMSHNNHARNEPKEDMGYYGNFGHEPYGPYANKRRHRAKMFS